MGEKLTDKQRYYMLHALGMNRSIGASRNHFIAAEEGQDAAIWRELVALGYASEEDWSFSEGSLLFRVTPSGKQALEASNG